MKKKKKNLTPFVKEVLKRNSVDKCYMHIFSLSLMCCASLKENAVIEVQFVACY